MEQINKFKYYYIYETTCLINNKKYIGQHKTNNLDDGYLGSGVLLTRAIKKYGKNNFIKEIICFAENLDDLNKLEKQIINNKNAVTDNQYYNLAKGGNNTEGFAQPEDVKKIISIKAKERFKNKENHPYYGKHLSEEQKKKISESTKSTFKNGRKPSKQIGEEHHQWGKRGKDACKFGKKESATARKNKSIAKKLWFETHEQHKLTEETKKKLSETRKRKFASGEIQPNRHGMKCVLCVETGIIYESISEAARQNSLNKANLSKCCQGKVPRCGKKHWKFVSDDNTVPNLQETV